MICISINQESRRLALVDMLNARHFGDILEIRLDRFGKSPDIGELLAAKPRPVIMSCRRPEDGGHWDGSETDRLAILRQCIISKADYVEIELDAADAIRPFPPTKRVISYTNLSETPRDILEIYEDAKNKRPDVIKLTVLAETPEEAWPLVQILARAVVPTVVVGLGKPGMMLSILSQKLGAPWVYAALERGMEAYPGQPTVSDLEAIYRLGDIGKSTRLIGVTGFDDTELMTVAGLNAAFAHLELSYRCLPLGIGDLTTFRKIMEAAKIAGAIIDADHQSAILDIEPVLHGIAKETLAADVVIFKNEGWHGVHTSCQAWIASLKEMLKKRYPIDNPLKDRFVLIAGLTAAKVIAAEVQRQGGNAIIASNDKKTAQALAQSLGCRFIAFDALYTTMHDVLVVCDEEKDKRTGRAGIRPTYLKPGMGVMDLTAGAKPSQLLREAEARGCATVAPLDLLLQTLELQAKVLTGKVVPREVILKAIPERLLHDD